MDNNRIISLQAAKKYTHYRTSNLIHVWEVAIKKLRHIDLEEWLPTGWDDYTTFKADCVNLDGWVKEQFDNGLLVLMSQFEMTRGVTQETADLRPKYQWRPLYEEFYRKRWGTILQKATKHELDIIDPRLDTVEKMMTLLPTLRGWDAAKFYKGQLGLNLYPKNYISKFISADHICWEEVIK